MGPPAVACLCESESAYNAGNVNNVNDVFKSWLGPQDPSKQLKLRMLLALPLLNETSAHFDPMWIPTAIDR